MAPSTTRAWVVACLLAALAVAGVALTGGFAPASRAPGIEAQPGEEFSLTRWDVSVESCTYVPPVQGADGEGSVVVAMSVTNTWDQTMPYMEDATYLLELPNGDRFGGGTGTYARFADAETPGGFDPGFRRPAHLTADLLSPYWGDDEPVRLRFSGEKLSDGFLFGGEWVADRQVAAVSLPCPPEVAG